MSDVPLNKAEMTVSVVDTGDSPINPAKEDGNLLSIKTQTDKLSFGSGPGVDPLNTYARGRILGGFTPDPDWQPLDIDENGEMPLSLHDGGQLAVRGQVLTDEGGFRDDFGGTGEIESLSTGTAVLVTGSREVQGTGFLSEGLNKDWYIYGTGDDASITRILKVESDTLLYLEAPYPGAGATGQYAKTKWVHTVAATGSITLGSSIVNITGGTGATDLTMISREADYLPLSFHCLASVSQRVANQRVAFGFAQGVYAGAQAFVLFDGTSNITAKLVTAGGSNPTDIETTPFAIPSGLATSSALNYDLHVSENKVELFVENTLVATHVNHIPAPYDTMNLVAGVENSAAQAISTNLAVDVIFASNYNLVRTESIPEEHIRNASGSIGATGAQVTVDSGGFASHSAVITGTWSGVLVSETSSDGGATWIPSSIFTPAASVVTAGIPVVYTSMTVNGTYRFGTSGSLTNIRIRAASWVSGTAIIRLTSTTNANMFGFTNSAIIQNVVTSILNSYTSNLAAGATFTGTSEPTTGIAGIQVALMADQNCTIYVEQSPDGTNWDISDSYRYVAAVGYGRTIKATLPFYRVRVINTGASTTTYLRLTTSIRPITESMPRNLSNSGNLKVAIQEGSDKTTYGVGTSFSIAAAATDVFTIYGSANKIIRIIKIVFAMSQNASAIETFSLYKRSATNTGGTSSLLTVVPFDSLNPAASATVRAYTANPTALGAAVGIISSFRTPVPQFTGTSVNMENGLRLLDNNVASQAVCLRSASEGLCVNFNGGTATGNVVAAYIEWTEEVG